MTIAIVLIFVFLILAALIAIAQKKKKEEAGIESNWPYKARIALSEPEQVLYFRLIEAMPGLIVLGQVGLSRVIEPIKGSHKKWFWKISQKSLDFVVCRKDASVVAAIELDDSTHKRRNRQQADTDKDKALGDAGVSIIRWDVKSIPSVEEIKTTFAKLLVEQNQKSKAQHF